MAPRTLLLLLSLIFVMVTHSNAQPSFFSQYCQKDRGSYTNTSDYKSNLNTLLTNLPSTDGNGFGFYILSLGQGIDEVHVVALCRGDLATKSCRGCVQNATAALPMVCPNQKEAVGWYPECFLRYSNRSLLGTVESSPIFYAWNPNNVSSNVEGFFQSLRLLLDGLKNRAASGGPLRKFAMGNTTTPSFQTIYALAQCTPDLSREDCNSCLDDAFALIPECCAGKIGGRVMGPSCTFRFETYLFYVPAPPPTPQALAPPPPNPSTTNSTTSTQGHGSNTKRTVIIVVSCAGVLFLVLIITAFVCLTSRRKKQRALSKLDQPRPSTNLADEIEKAESLLYDFETIQTATDNFSEANKLGEGGFGPVYKGQLSSGEVVAVKRLSYGSGQGNAEFKNEVTLLAKLQHRNLVRFLGFCLKGSERLLVYEFVPNSSLDRFIFDLEKRADLDWSRRYKIIGGIARGILYLHEDSRLKIIHRDLKASNILLDEEMHPKISDFGMARLFNINQTQGVTSRVVGTYGYMAPEYVMQGHISVKTDVFSFGVLILEIVSGQKNNCFRHETQVEDLLAYTWINWKNGTTSNIVDPLIKHAQTSELIKCIHIALLCVQENVENRPTMNAIVLMLNSNSVSMPAPSEPAFLMHSDSGTNTSMDFNSNGTQLDHSKNEPAQPFSAETSITELYPR